MEGKKTDISCLSLGRARILHMPGELFVEYQLAAKAERPDLFVAMAAYGDYGPEYICTDIAYSREVMKGVMPQAYPPVRKRFLWQP